MGCAIMEKNVLYNSSSQVLFIIRYLGNYMKAMVFRKVA